VRYIEAVLDDLKSRVSYDSRRVYATGFSYGAAMVHRLACEMSTRLAGASAVEGTIKVPVCTPARVVPFIHWAALGDDRVPFFGGEGDTSVPYTVSIHLANLGLPPFRSPTEYGAALVLHTLSQQAGHTWLYEKPPAFDWQQMNWDFLSSYSLPSTTGKRRAARH
jgi:dienelactone hydrolase